MAKADAMNPSSQGANQQPMFTVVLRCAESQLRVPEGRAILITPITSEHGNYELKVLTRSDQEPKIQTPIPRELWIEVRGPAPSMDIAISIATGTANELLRHVALAANAWQGLLSVHLAYESSPEIRERRFFQNWVTDERGLPRSARTIDPELMVRFLVAVVKLEAIDRNRIDRAIAQYSDALQHWKVGNELYALAHLYMGVEAITPTAIRWEIKRRGLKNNSELRRALNLPIPPLKTRIAGWLYIQAGGKIANTSLDPWARREIIFRGDAETFRTARKASDDLEHGLSPHVDVQRLAVKCVGKCASYLRDAILEFIPVSDVDRAALKTEPYATPSNTGGFGRQLLATISSEEGEIAAPEQAYPLVQWAFVLKDFKVNDKGVHEMHMTQKITPIIAPGAKFNLSKIHFSGKTEAFYGAVEVTVVGKQTSTSAAGVEVSVNDPANAKWAQPIGSLLLNCNAVIYHSAHWVLRLTKRQANEIPSISLKVMVDEILAIISHPEVPHQIQSDCKAAWVKALELEDVMAVFSGCLLQPEGVLPVGKWERGKVPIISDLGKLNDLNNEVVELCKRLSNLLDEVVRLPLFTIADQGK